MTTKTVLENEAVVIDSPSEVIFRAYVPFFRENVSSLKTDDEGRKYRVVEGAIIVDRRAVQEQMGWTDEDASDHFTTLWEVDGFLTDIRKVNFDFRHNGLSTGAVGERSWVVDDYEVQIDDKVLKVRARMIAVRVYEDNQIRIKGKNGETIEDGNLLANIENGRVFTWSVRFAPVRQYTTRSGLTVFKTYHTPEISFLDITQGIPDAGGFTLRSFLQDTIIKNNNMSLEEIKQLILENKVSLEDLQAVLQEIQSTEAVEETPTEEPKEENVEQPEQPEQPVQEEPQEAPVEETQLEAPTQEEEPNQERNIIIEKEDEQPQEGEQQDEQTTEGEEMSDEEMRKYIKDWKRACKSPEELLKRLDGVESTLRAMTETKTEDEMIDQRVNRSLTSNLDDVPEAIKTEVSEEQTQLDEGSVQLDTDKEEEIALKKFRLKRGYNI